MTLLDQCASLKERAERLKNLRETAEEAKALSTRLSEARELKERLQSVSEKVAFLKENEIEIDLSAAAQVTPLPALDKIIEQFTDKPEAASLTKRQYWTKLREQGAEWQKKLDAEADKSWRGFIDDQYSGRSPAQLEASLAQTQSNQRALKAFTAIHRDLKFLREDFPENPQTVKRARELSEELKSVSEAFDFDVPDDVRAFLAAINQEGAPLELLTEEVLDWLRANKSESQYRIVGTG